MNKCESIIERFNSLDEKEDALARLQARIKKMKTFDQHKDKVFFIVAEQTLEDEAVGAIKIKAQIQKELKDSDIIIATTDIEKAGDESIETNYYAGASKEDAATIIKALKKADKKNGYFKLFVDDKEIKTMLGK